jgi:hypothetical protein
MVQSNISDAFIAIGFTHDIGQNPYGLLLDEEEFRQSRGFAAFWWRKMPLDNI